MQLEPPLSTFIFKAKDGVDKLQNLITDLLDVSKIEAGQLQLNEKEVDVDILVDECISEATMNSFTHKIRREGELLKKVVIGDKDRLEQVINNFISNAIKYSPGADEIIVSARDSDKGIVVTVTDFGIGIPASEQEKVFERFYRASEINAVISGFGLGLYICSQIIKRHGGKIGVNSVEGKGSSFYFYLPLK